MKKRNKNIKSIILFSIISIYTNVYLCISVYSQDSLMNYLEIAAKNNPTVLQKYNEYQAALQKVPQVGSLPDPELSVGVFLSPMEVMNGNQVADIKLMQMFPWFGVLKNAKDEMSLMAKARYESLQEAKLQVFYDVQRKWYELYKVKQNISITEKNIEILHTLERLSLARFQANQSIKESSAPTGKNMANATTQNTSTGMNTMGSNQPSTINYQPSTMSGNPMGSGVSNSSLADLYRIQMEAGELENNLELLKSQQHNIVARFNSYLNRSPQIPVEVPESLKQDTLKISIAAVSDSILKNSPMLSMLQYDQQSLEARKKMISRMGYPMVGLGVNYSLINKNDLLSSDMNGEDMIMPMVTITLPIYRKKYKAMQNEATLMSQATEQNYRATANSLQNEYYEALQLYEDAGRRIKLYNKQCELASKTLDIMIKSYSASGSELNEILRVQQQTLDYQFKQIEALVDYNTAIAWLKRLGNIN